MLYVGRNQGYEIDECEKSCHLLDLIHLMILNENFHALLDSEKTITIIIVDAIHLKGSREHKTSDLLMHIVPIQANRYTDEQR